MKKHLRQVLIMVVTLMCVHPIQISAAESIPISKVQLLVSEQLETLTINKEDAEELIKTVQGIPNLITDLGLDEESTALLNNLVNMTGTGVASFVQLLQDSVSASNLEDFLNLALKSVGDLSLTQEQKDFLYPLIKEQLRTYIKENPNFTPEYINNIQITPEMLSALKIIISTQ